MTPAGDPLISALHRIATAACPATVRERVAEQALADLAQERLAATGTWDRGWITCRGVVLLGVALVWSVWALRAHWENTGGFARNAAGWFVLMTLLVMLRFGLTAFGPQHVLDPVAVLCYLAPLAVPAAALGLALTLRVDRLRLVMLLACLAGTVSMALTMGPHLIADSAQVPEAVGPVTTLAQWVWGLVEWPLQLASLSALLPILGWLIVRALRVAPTQVTSLLISIAVLESLRLWLRLRATVPSDAWVPHLVLLTGIMLTAAALRLRREGHVR